MVLRMWVQWNHLNLDHASLRGRRLLSPSLPFICLLSSHSMLHTVWGLLFKSMHPLTISHMYITPSHTPPPPPLSSAPPNSFLGTGFHAPVSLFHFVLILCLTEVNLGVAWTWKWRTRWSHHWRQWLPLQQPAAQGGARLLEFRWVGAF